MFKHLTVRRQLLRFKDDGGSMVMALLAAIVVAGLVSIIVATTITGQRAARFDQDFTGALHVAEAGVQEALFKLNNRQIKDGDSESGPVTGGGEVNGRTYEWSAEQISEHEWKVLSTRTDDGVTRSVEAVISDGPLFNLAAFADNLLNLGGTNHADSYHSGWNNSTGTLDSALQEWCTGKGRVGSNDGLDFSGSGSGTATCAYARTDQTVDGVDLYDWSGENADPDRCTHSGGSNCVYNGEAQYETHEHGIEFDEDVAWMEDVLDRCSTLPDIAASDFDGQIPPADATTGVKLHEGDDDSPYAYCAKTLTFDVHTSLDGASPANPVVFMVEDWVEANLSGGNRLRVNCDDCTANNLNPAAEDIYPQAGALQIYTPSADGASPDSGDVIGIRQHSRVAAAIYAPRGTCGGTGNAQVHIFGALICWDIPGVGGWNFHYDEALAEQIRTHRYSIIRWAEQQG